MRASAILAVTIFVLGAYLALAAGLGLDARWIAIGLLGIAAAGAVSMTVALAAPQGAPRSAGLG
jgi:hypothetical protein